VLAFFLEKKMSTRSWIAVKEGDCFRVIYCHHDGYPEGVGQCLVANYDSLDRVLALVGLGAISGLHDTVEDTFPKSYKARGEYDPALLYMDKTRLVEDFVETCCKYLYLHEEGVWWVYPTHLLPRIWRQCASVQGWWRVMDILALPPSLSRRSYKAWLTDRNHGQEVVHD
jgi:hypothetical protein